MDGNSLLPTFPKIFSKASYLSSIILYSYSHTMMASNARRISQFSCVEKCSNSLKPANKKVIWFCNRFFARINHEENMKEQEKPEQVVIAANGQLPRNFERFWTKATLRICADGGANRLYDFFEGSEERRIQ